MAEILNLKWHLLSLHCSDVTKDILVTEDFLGSWFRSGLCPMLSLQFWVRHQFYSFVFFSVK